MLDIKSQYKRLFLSFTIIHILLFSCPYIWGQTNQKRYISKEEYSLWSKLVARKLSDNGNWASYLLMYESNKDTLFVKNTKVDIAYNFPNTKEGKFNGEYHFACIANDTLMIQNLKTGRLTKTAGVSDFSFSKNQKYLVLLKKELNNKFKIIIRSNEGNMIEQFVNVTQWRFEEEKKGIVYTTESENNHSIGFVNMDSSISKKVILKNSNTEFQNLIWKDKTIAFVQNNTEQPILYSFQTEKELLSQFQPDRYKNFPSDLKISDKIFNNLMISDNGEQLFFWLKENTKNVPIVDPKSVQIWNTKDKLLYAYKKNIGEFKHFDKMAVWNLKNDKFQQITDRELPRGFLTGDYAHAFIYDPIAYEPQSNLQGPIDLYISDLTTGRKKCILEHYLSDTMPMPIPSPDGQNLLYAKDGNWWIYDIKKDSHINITFGLSNSFFNKNQDMPIQPSPYGIGGWLKDGKSIVIYDQYDLWQIALDGISRKRLTKGRETQKTYRIKKFVSGFKLNDIEAEKGIIDLKKGFILSIVNEKTRESGFSKWTLQIEPKDIIWNSKKIDQLFKASHCESYMFVEQSYEVAPRLTFYNGSFKEIIQTNKQQQQFYWGKAEPIQFTTDGKKMNGTLYYPAGYNSSIKYPMIVHIYERQFQYFNDYENPSLYISDGFNINNLVQKGYFVLLPDMAYTMGDLVSSTTKSVLAAVDSALEKASIDSKKIGLIGHSFGGYETDLIITQTNRFAAAVSGAAWTDVVSTYLYVGPTFSGPDYYRAEYNQLRIGKSLYEDKESYLKNSPVLLASNVSTPLLGWAGEGDRHIHSLQSMEFYLALRRLNKTHTLLVYPEEEHTLEKGENQKDLAERIVQWFDYYLKDAKIHEWMKTDN